jgi:hypothetical protein
LAISKAVKAFYKDRSHPSINKKGALSPQYGIGHRPIYVYDVNSKQLVKFFPSINATIKSIRVKYAIIMEALTKGLLLKDKWIVSYTSLSEHSPMFSNYIKPEDIFNKARVKGYKIYVYAAKRGIQIL